MFGSTDLDSALSKLRITLPSTLSDWTDRQVEAGGHRDAAAYVVSLIDADMGPTRHQDQSRSEWVKAQVKSRNFKDAASYVRHLIEQDMTAKTTRKSPLASIETDILSHLLYIRKTIDKLQERIQQLEKQSN